MVTSLQKEILPAEFGESAAQDLRSPPGPRKLPVPDLDTVLVIGFNGDFNSVFRTCLSNRFQDPIQ